MFHRQGIDACHTTRCTFAAKLQAAMLEAISLLAAMTPAPP